ncbi:lipoate protein ligase C-terminal domain-containing protein [Acidianus sp. RZ1]|uniref:lipoate protein ligase C-terminal domain-containing protein n=1 Tax=Acidianus sp. RZ1 TaxID=1540082 RepID=UPI001491781C|nr:lipoate protein ligase C-terminal domain-containing protein [Acidianus sp. RZ1]NON61581.1 lipoate--protein ligase family protein [Acidianus sp. RZ1]
MLRKFVFKAKKGLIRVKVDANGTIHEIQITGDFFIYPEEALPLLEKKLIGTPYKKEEVKRAISSFVKENNVQMPFVTEEDFVRAIMGES